MFLKFWGVGPVEKKSSLHGRLGEVLFEQPIWW